MYGIMLAGVGDAAVRAVWCTVLLGAGDALLPGALFSCARSSADRCRVYRIGPEHAAVGATFFLYAGLPRVGIKFCGDGCAVIGLTFLGGAYMAEAFRSGLEAVDNAQVEAGACIGLTRRQNIRYVIFPQALATAVPALFANVIFLIKETSVFSVLAMMDLMNVADTLRTSGGRTVEVLFMLVAAYLIILLPVSVIATMVERRLRYAGFGDQHSV